MIGFGIFMALKDTLEKSEIPEEPEIKMRDDIKVVIDPGHGKSRVSQMEEKL